MVNSGPECVHTERLAISRWDVVVIKTESSEVVLSIIEGVIRKVFGTTRLIDVVHENDVFLSVRARHDFHEGPDI